MKERIMQLNDRFTGSRFLRGINIVGGMAMNLSPTGLKDVIDEMELIEKDFLELTEILFYNASLTDRLETTGVLTERVAWDHAVMGVVGRASNINRDVRRDHPFAAYSDLTFKVPTYTYGDVRARMRVRIDEVREALDLIRQAIKRMPDGPIAMSV